VRVTRTDRGRRSGREDGHRALEVEDDPLSRVAEQRLSGRRALPSGEEDVIAAVLFGGVEDRVGLVTDRTSDLVLDV
jgi:hypothetical protein